MRIKISPTEIPMMIKLTADLTGISLDEKKSYLFEGRLTSILNDFKLDSYQSLARQIHSHTGLKEAFINAIVTDETSFFRDQRPFELLAHKLIPDLIEQHANRSVPELRIWSAASSRGQEVYSIAMVLKETLNKLENYSISITATDISSKSLEYASAGLYSKFEMSRGMTLKRLQNHFTQEGSAYRVRPELRNMVSFQRLNLLKPLPHLGPFHLVFCRNVLVYFNIGDRQRVYEQIAEKMRPKGYLVIGSTEHLPSQNKEFKQTDFQGKSYYQKVKR